ncbi:hypothetical protein DFP72DRAFT_925470 [Ephemerocybe angulata]|uniref:Uncharacterized protein n=1 Tax=Ephemerocybe angulata TaxID=980116 RepID=A0A8H6HGC6_9AGAR|nr:hypothetical protein DFP72DRAFT_925470 [Tulosesus angulatus]
MGGKGALVLNPGAMKRRGPSRLKRLMFRGCMVVSCLVVLGIAKFASVLYKRAQFPHQFMYKDLKPEEVEDWSNVVRPLVDENTKFDIVATVWVANRTFDFTLGNEWAQWAGQSPEEHIFSGVIFRGVTLSDKHVHARVNLSIPLENFSAEYLENNDLRASFTLIPQAPSLLDNMTDYSSWFLDGPIVPPQMRPHQYPQFTGVAGEAKELLKWRVQEAIDSFGVSTPLLQFHHIRSSCGQERREGTTDSETSSRLNDELPGWPTTRGKTPLEAHPYFITRTALRVVRMTKLYDAVEYNAFHEHLRSDLHGNGCASEDMDPDSWDPKDSRTCYRNFLTRSNAETKITILAPDPRTGEDIQQTVYAPFLDVSESAWGPLDLVPLPVSRESCSGGSESVKEGKPKTFDVVWNVAFSASSPLRVLLAENIGSAYDYNVTDTEFNKARAQTLVEDTQRLAGHKFSFERHSGTLTVISMIRLGLSHLQPLLALHYWYTRKSTVGITILGSALLAACFLLRASGDLWLAGREGLNPPSMAVPVCFFHIDACMYTAITISILKTILTISRAKGGLISLKMVPPSHEERASSRLERGGTRLLILVLFASLALYFSEWLSDYTLIPRSGPLPDAPPPSMALFKTMSSLILSPLITSADTYQLILNYRAKTYAGQYKLKAWLELLTEFVLSNASYVPWVAGKPTLRDAVPVSEVVYQLIVVGFAVQAALYPVVSQEPEEDESSM